MDPCSIPSLCLAVAGLCYTAYTQLDQFIEASQIAHSTWRGFNDEIKALENVLHSISSSLEKSDLLRRYGPRHENQHWLNVGASINDCERSIEAFLTLLESIKVSEDRHSLIAKPLQQFRLNQSMQTMTVIRNQIISYKDTLSVSLQMISVLSIQRTAGSVEKVSDELDRLSLELIHVRHHLQSPAASTEKSAALPVSQSEASLPSYDAVLHDKEVKKNLENCIKSAQRVWSTTSNAIATVKGSIDELSVIGEPLSPKSLHDINEWVGRLSTDERDALPADDSAGSVLTSNVSHEHETATESLPSVADDMLFKEDSLFNADEEMFHIEACEEEAAKCLELGDFSAAEDAQKDAIRYLERRHARMGTPFEKENEMREVLTKIYYKQEKLEKAAETLKLLSLTEESPPDRPWKWQHRLAEVYIELDRLNDALRWCGLAKRGREKEHGTKHRLFLESIVLSARIYELRGETRIVGTWRKMYPEAFASTRNEEKRQESVALLQQNGFDCTSENWDSAQGVEWAASQGEVEAVGYLLMEEQAEPMASQRLEKKGLVSAASSGQLAVVQMLLDKNVDVDVTDAEGSTGLLLAVQNGQKEVVRILLDRGANVEARDRQRRRTALHLAQYQHENEEISRLLVNKGADVNAKDWKKQRPLHIAAEHGQRTTAEILLKCGADIHARDDTYRTALHIAICEKHLEVVKLLLAYGAQGDLGLVGIAKTRSIPAIAKLVEEKVRQQGEEKSRLEKEKKKHAKEVKEQERESKKKSKDWKPSGCCELERPTGSVGLASHVLYLMKLTIFSRESSAAFCCRLDVPHTNLSSSFSSTPFFTSALQLSPPASYVSPHLAKHSFIPSANGLGMLFSNCAILVPSRNVGYPRSASTILGSTLKKFCAMLLSPGSSLLKAAMNTAGAQLSLNSKWMLPCGRIAPWYCISVLLICGGPPFSMTKPVRTLSPCTTVRNSEARG